MSSSISEIFFISILEICYVNIIKRKKVVTMKVNEMIVNLREKRNISQRELANRIGINKSVMNRIESGERDVRAHELEAIANYFDVSTDYLLGREEFDNRDLLAAHIDDDLTEEERIEIEKYLKFIRSQKD